MYSPNLSCWVWKKSHGLQLWPQQGSFRAVLSDCMDLSAAAYSALIVLGTKGCFALLPVNYRPHCFFWFEESFSPLISCLTSWSLNLTFKLLYLVLEKKLQLPGDDGGRTYHVIMWVSHPSHVARSCSRVSFQGTMLKGHCQTGTNRHLTSQAWFVDDGAGWLILRGLEHGAGCIKKVLQVREKELGCWLIRLMPTLWETLHMLISKVSFMVPYILKGWRTTTFTAPIDVKHWWKWIGVHVASLLSQWQSPFAVHPRPDHGHGQAVQVTFPQPSSWWRRWGKRPRNEKIRTVL